MRDLRVNGGRVPIGNIESDLTVLNTGAVGHHSMTFYSFQFIRMSLKFKEDILFIFVTYSDDMVLIGLYIERKYVYAYHASSLQDWCQKSFLEINVCNTK